ncbi:hypothetical protein V8E51_016223 [Hyaloscypha variabilis]|jgi:hypothetical protein
MSTSDPSTFDSLALVNSFYGPGATACWYLTCLACLILWTFHPKKQKSDSITSDFIALVTFPTVAAAHLISQVQNYPSQSSLDDQLAKQIHASMSASLTITETYLSLCIILLAPAVLSQSTKRIVLLALTGLFCVASETYVFFAIPSIRNKRIFTRSFIIDSLPTLVMILGLVFMLVLMLLYFIFLTFKRPPPRAEPRPDADPEVLIAYRLANEEHNVNSNILMLNLLTILYLPLGLFSGMFSMSPAAVDMLPSLAKRLARIVPATGKSLVHEFFPETDTGIMELDQAVALLAGMTVLGFSLYSTADERYKIWWEKEKRSRESAAQLMVERRAQAAEWRRGVLADEAAQRSVPEFLELSDLQNFRLPPPIANTVSSHEAAATY